MKKLTIKQKRFADEYVLCGNATQAAIKAGYSKKTAYSMGNQNLKKLEVQNRIKEKLKEIENSKIMDMKEVRERLTAEARGETYEEQVVTEFIGDGESRATLVQKKISAKDRIKALELLGKTGGLFTDKLDINAEMVVIMDDIDEED